MMACFGSLLFIQGSADQTTLTRSVSEANQKPSLTLFEVAPFAVRGAGLLVLNGRPAFHRDRGAQALPELLAARGAPRQAEQARQAAEDHALTHHKTHASGW
jgi:hypothetical protein